MPHELPYLSSYKNVATLFKRIQSARVPESFTQQFLKETLGLKSSSDRPLIALLKDLGMLDSSGKPTPRYSALKNDAVAGQQIADGVREAYRPLFDANEKAHELDNRDLKGLIAQVAGTDKGATDRIAWTFKALAKEADWTANSDKEHRANESPSMRDEIFETPGQEAPTITKNKGELRPEFHYNIQIHLPANGSEETYLNIFSALRQVFQ